MSKKKVVKTIEQPVRMPEPTIVIPVSLAAKLCQLGRMADPTGAFIGPALQQMQRDIQEAVTIKGKG